MNTAFDYYNAAEEGWLGSNADWVLVGWAEARDCD